MIEWTNKLSVNHEKIDSQHKTFIMLINKLEDLTKSDNYLENLPILLNEIVEYASLHFKTEEKIMAEINYPGLEKHKEEHEHIKSDIYKECKRVAEMEATTLDVIWLYNYMRDWVKTHILEEDKAYVRYLK
jgi:hemerythrin-like metal-binding protein